MYPYSYQTDCHEGHDQNFLPPKYSIIVYSNYWLLNLPRQQNYREKGKEASLLCLQEENTFFIRVLSNGTFDWVASGGGKAYFSKFTLNTAFPNPQVSDIFFLFLSYKPHS